MHLKLVLPDFSKEIRSGTMARWHVEEGDPVAFGGDLFDLLVTERVKMARPGDPRAVLQAEASDPRFVTRATEVYFRVVSADLGVLREVRVEAGTPVAVGDVVGIVSTDPEADGPAPSSVDGLPEVRVAVNLLEGVDPSDV